MIKNEKNEAHFDRIEKAIIEALDKIIAENRVNRIGNRDNWTKKIKEALCNLGEAHEFDAWTNGFKERYEGEFLYDIVWSQSSGAWTEYVPLVVESEWDRNFHAIDKDFQKLLFANSEHKLMICEPKSNEVEKCKAHFSQSIAAYKQLKSGDRFLIAIFQGDQFEYLLIIKK